MKIYLASFLQKQNFGPGRLISVARGDKPNNLSVTDIFLPLTPAQELLTEYNSLRPIEPAKAGDLFVSSYEKQLDDFCHQVESDAQMEKLSPVAILPFQDGDTLCSWERKEFTNYRRLIAPRLTRLGYEVVLN